MGKHRDEIWQELNDHDARLSVLEDRGQDAAELRAENAVLTHNIRETMGLVKGFRIERDELQAENARLLAERDHHKQALEVTRALLDDCRTERDALRARIEAGDVADERKGERRSKQENGFWDNHARLKRGRRFSTTNDRRRTPGTRAMRGQA